MGLGTIITGVVDRDDSSVVDSAAAVLISRIRLVSDPHMWAISSHIGMQRTLPGSLEALSNCGKVSLSGRGTILADSFHVFHELLDGKTLVVQSTKCQFSGKCSGQILMPLLNTLCCFHFCFQVVWRTTIS